jgi:hypothetical protein
MEGRIGRGRMLSLAAVALCLAGVASAFALGAFQRRPYAEIRPDPATIAPAAGGSIAAGSNDHVSAARAPAGAGVTVPAQSWDHPAAPLAVCLKHDNAAGDPICADGGPASWPASFHPTPEHPTPMTVCFEDDKAPGKVICPGEREELALPLR